MHIRIKPLALLCGAAFFLGLGPAADAGNPQRINHTVFLPRRSGPDDGGLYNAFIDPATHRMGRWDYELEGKEHEKGSWTWQDWKKIGPLMLCADKKENGGDTMIRTPFQTVSETVDESAFKDPATGR